MGASTAAASRQATEAFLRRLHELGWIEGRTVMIEYRWAEGRSERYAEIAAEFVRLQVNVMVTVGGAVPAAKKATSAKSQPKRAKKRTARRSKSTAAAPVPVMETAAQ